MIEVRKIIVFLCVTMLLFYMIRLLLFTKRKWPLKSYTFAILIGGITLIVVASFFDMIENILNYEFVNHIIRIGFTLGAIIYVIGIILWSKFTKAIMNKLEEIALTDCMTGVLNRSGIERVYDSLIETNDTFYVIVCDLDGTKVINDTYGHIEGDRYIDETTKIITDIIGLKGHVSRIGGDEFVILLEEMCKDEIEEIIFKIKKLVDKIYCNENTGISLGYSVFPEDGETLGQLIKAADKKMYEDKKMTRIC